MAMTLGPATLATHPVAAAPSVEALVAGPEVVVGGPVGVATAQIVSLEVEVVVVR